MGRDIEVLAERTGVGKELERICIRIETEQSFTGGEIEFVIPYFQVIDDVSRIISPVPVIMESVLTDIVPGESSQISSDVKVVSVRVVDNAFDVIMRQTVCLVGCKLLEKIPSGADLADSSSVGTDPEITFVVLNHFTNVRVIDSWLGVALVVIVEVFFLARIEITDSAVIASEPDDSLSVGIESEK